MRTLRQVHMRTHGPDTLLTFACKQLVNHMSCSTNKVTEEVHEQSQVALPARMCPLKSASKSRRSSISGRVLLAMMLRILASQSELFTCAQYWWLAPGMVFSRCLVACEHVQRKTLCVARVIRQERHEVKTHTPCSQRTNCSANSQKGWMTSDAAMKSR